MHRVNTQRPSIRGAQGLKAAAALVSVLFLARCAPGSKPQPSDKPAPKASVPLQLPASTPAQATGAVHPLPAEVREASGAVYIPATEEGGTGQYLLAGDEAEYSFYLLDEAPGGAPYCRRPSCILKTPEPLSDVEGLARDPATGWIYAITSHSLTKAGERKEHRERLVRFRLEGGLIASMEIRTGFREALIANPAVGPRLLAASERPAESGGINIEGLAWDADKRWLWIGFRSPVGREAGTDCAATSCEALLLPLMNPKQLFEQPGATADLGRPIWLDLGGQGIRDVAIVPDLKFFMIPAGSPTGAPQPFRFVAALRDGTVRDFTQKVTAFQNLSTPEGVAIVRPFTDAEYFFVTDNGGGAPSTWLLTGLAKKPATAARE